MPHKTDSVIKSYFETGDYPSQSQFGDFIDSKLQTQLEPGQYLKDKNGNILITSTGFNPDLVSGSKIKISSTDILADFLINKLVASTGVIFTRNNIGGNENIHIGLDGGTIGSVEAELLNKIYITSTNLINETHNRTIADADLLNRIYITSTNSIYGLSLKEPTITVLPISKGGTNSNVSLINNRIIKSSAGAIIESDKSFVTTLGTDDLTVPTSKAVKDYADVLISLANALVYKGTINCSVNPNYPAASTGWLFVVSSAGLIGGVSGVEVEVGDMCICNTDGTPSGDQATVGSKWDIIQKNIIGAVTGPASSINNAIALFNGLTGKVIKDSSITITTILGTDDTTVPTSKAVKDVTDLETSNRTIQDANLLNRIYNTSTNLLTETYNRTISDNNLLGRIYNTSTNLLNINNDLLNRIYVTSTNLLVESYNRVVQDANLLNRIYNTSTNLLTEIYNRAVADNGLLTRIYATSTNLINVNNDLLNRIYATSTNLINEIYNRTVQDANLLGRIYNTSTNLLTEIYNRTIADNNLLNRIYATSTSLLTEVYNRTTADSDLLNRIYSTSTSLLASKYKVKASSGDTTPNYLDGKIYSSTNILISKQNDKLVIATIGGNLEQATNTISGYFPLLHTKLEDAASITSPAFGKAGVYSYTSAGTFDPGKFGNAMFNATGQDSTATFSNVLFTKDRGSIEFWVYYSQPTASPGETTLITGIGTFSISPNATQPARVVLGGVTLESASGLNYDTWYHLGFSWNVNGINGTPKTIIIYINGIEDASTTSALNITNPNNIIINPAPGAFVPSAGIDEVIVWGDPKTSFVLTEQTILTSALYSSENFIVNGMPFNEAISTLDGDLGNAITSASNLGTGIGVFKQKSSTGLQFKSLKASSGIAINPTLTDIIIGTSAEANTASNVGAGVGVFKQKSGVDLQFKTLVASSGIAINPATSTVIIGTNAEANTASNLGTGSQIFKQKSGIDLQFRSLTASTGTIISQAANDIKVAIPQSVATTASPTFNDVTLSGAIGDTFTNLFTDVKEPTGVPVGERGKFKVSVSYSAPNVVATVSFVGANTSFHYYINGKKYVITSSGLSALTASATAAEGVWFVYIDSSNVFTLTQTAWTISNPDVLLWNFYFNATANTITWIGEERHTAGRDIFQHARNHAQGALYKSGLLASQLNGLTNFSGDTQDSPGRAQALISNGNFFDEDILDNITHTDASVNASVSSPATDWNLNVNQFLGFTALSQAGSDSAKIIFPTTRTLVTGQSVTIMNGNTTTVRGSSTIYRGSTSNVFALLPSVTGAAAGDAIVIGARIPIYYISAVAGSVYTWRKLTSSSFLGVTGGAAYTSSTIASGVAQFNNAAAGGFSTITTNRYFPVYLLATNSTFEPVIAILGQAQSTNATLATALTEAAWQFSNVVGLSYLGIQEAVPFYRLTFIYNTAAAFTTTRLKLVDVTFLNVRVSTVSGQVTFAPSSTISATNVITDTTNFNNKLSVADTTAQLALDTLDDHSHTATEIGAVSNASNLGTGSNVFAQKSSTGLQFRSLVASTNVILTQEANDIKIGVIDSGSEVTTAANIGTGVGVYYQKVGTQLQFKSLVSSTNIAINFTSTNIIIGAAGGSAAASSTSIIFTLRGNAYTGTKLTQGLVSKPFDVQKVFLFVDTAPSGADLIVDINKNGTTIFSTQANRPTIANGATSAISVAPDIVHFTYGDRISVDVDQVGSSTVGGNDLLINISVK